MRSFLLRFACGSLLAALIAVPAAHSAIGFKGFSAKREQALRQDLAKSAFPFSALLNVTVEPGNLPPGTLGLATSGGLVQLSAEVFASADVRAFALFHELAHQIDYQLLANSERSRYYEAAGFGPGVDVKGFADRDWYDPGVAHHRIPAEQFASAVPLVVWPATSGNSFITQDGACLGWQQAEGCAAPLNIVAAIVNSVLARNGRAPLGQRRTAPKVSPETFVPPRISAPAKRLLPDPDPQVSTVPTALTLVKPLRATQKRESALRVRLKAALGVVPGTTVLIDYRDKHGWWALGEFRTNHRGIVVYRFKPKGWRPKAFRVTFAGQANLAASALVVRVKYRK